MKNISKLKNGFTLVELAIVLVIIGLLVGGVLQGKELIEQAKIRSHISTVNSFVVGYNAFKLKYNAIPGDARKATSFFSQSDVLNGDGDRRIELIDNSGILTNYQENRQALYQLYLSSLLKSKESIWNENTPIYTKINDVGYMLTFASSSINSSVTYNANIINLGDLNTGTGLFHNAAFTSSQARILDEKIDDGLPNTGNTIGEPARTFSGSWVNVSGCLTSGGVNSYDLTTAPEDKTCLLGIILEK